MATLQDYHNTGDDTTAGVSHTSWRAMTFTAVNGYTFGSVKLKLYTLSVPDFVVASIRATDGTLPIGDDLAYGEIAGTGLEVISPGDWATITFSSPYGITSGTKYAIVFRTKTSGTCEWRLDTDGGYVTGSRCDSANSGVDWTEGTTSHDYMFECHVGGALNIQSSVTLNHGSIESWGW